MRSLRKALRLLTRNVPFKGRYRLADRLGAWLAGRDPVEIIEINGIRIQLDHRELLHRLMYYGLYEENVMNFLRQDLRPGEVVFDPGANLGYFAAICRGLVGTTGHVYSFEPSNTAHAAVLKHNGIPPLSNWTLEHAALTDHSGTMTFYDTPRVMTMGFACLEGIYEPKDRLPHPVQVYSLDDYCARREIGVIAFLKLDIEGSELKALQGARHLLARKAVRTILVETTLDPHRAAAQAIDDLLRAAGYRSFRALRNGTLRPVEVMAEDRLREDILWRVQ